MPFNWKVPTHEVQIRDPAALRNLVSPERINLDALEAHREAVYAIVQDVEPALFQWILIEVARSYVAHYPERDLAEAAIDGIFKRAKAVGING